MYASSILGLRPQMALAPWGGQGWPWPEGTADWASMAGLEFVPPPLLLFCGCSSGAGAVAWRGAAVIAVVAIVVSATAASSSAESLMDLRRAPREAPRASAAAAAATAAAAPGASEEEGLVASLPVFF